MLVLVGITFYDQCVKIARYARLYGCPVALVGCYHALEVGVVWDGHLDDGTARNRFDAHNGGLLRNGYFAFLVYSVAVTTANQGDDSHQ